MTAIKNTTELYDVLDYPVGYAQDIDCMSEEEFEEYMLPFPGVDIYE